MSIKQTPFYDAADWTQIPNSALYVAGYLNGRYEWPDTAYLTRQGHFKIGVLSGVPAQAQQARCLDIERYDADADDAPPFIAERNSSGHNDALLYVDLDGIAELLEIIISAGQWRSNWGLWIAWWTLKPKPPTQAQVRAQIEARWGGSLPSRRIKAVQWSNGLHYDSSVWYGTPRFTSALDLPAEGLF